MSLMKRQQLLKRMFVPAANLAFVAILAWASSAQGQYRQLIGLPALSGDDGTGLTSGTIDGTTGYAILSGGGLHRIVKIDDIGRGNTVTTLVDTVTWNSTVDPSNLGAPSGIAGVPFVSGTSLLIADIVTDQIVEVDTTNGNATLLVDAATVAGGLQFAGLNQSNGNLLVYDTTSDSLFETDGSINGWNLVLNDTDLAAVAGDDTPAGVSGAANGVIYLGQSTSSAGENIYFYDPSGPSNGILATEADIVGPVDDVSFSATAFNILSDGRLYFSDGGTNDSFRSIDPSVGPSSLALEIGEAQLVAGPAASDFVSSFSLFEGNLAWVQTINAGGQIPGFYAVPEPASLTLIAGLAMAVVGWRRR